ncbi:hypothetical protein DL771_000771 [Monosporascus sp. 5C6A]|nr:hypothetical protein DL771_000771 [Monosporascus sp. 5C6A]
MCVTFVEENPSRSCRWCFTKALRWRVCWHSADRDTAAGNHQYANVLALVQVIYTDQSVAEAGDGWAPEWRDQLFEPEHSGYDHPAVYVNYAHGDVGLKAFYGYEPWRVERPLETQTAI